jgi:hypothetical protein
LYGIDSLIESKEDDKKNIGGPKDWCDNRKNTQSASQPAPLEKEPNASNKE